MFVFNEKEFEVGFVREVFDNRFSSSAKIKQRLKYHGFPFAVAIPSADKSKVLVSFGGNDQQYDYAAFAYHQAKDMLQDKAILIEPIEDNRYLYLRVTNGEIDSDKIVTEEDMLNDVYQTYKWKKDTENFDLIHAGAPNDQVRSVINKIAEPTYIDSILPQTRGGKKDRERLEPFRMRSVKEALQTKGIVRPKVKRTWAAIIAVVSISSALIMSDEPVQSQLQVIDPYKELKTLLTQTAVSPVPRLKQAYNMHLEMLQLPGWDLIEVDHMPSVSSYKIAQSSRGAIADLNTFAAKRNLSVAKLADGYQIVVPGLNRPVHKMAKDKVYYHSLENVTDILVGSIELWVPGVVVDIQRNQKGANDDWGKRQLVINFAGQYREDLLTISSIIESLNLPVALESANYKVKNEELNGSLVVTIIGKVEA